MNAGVAESQQIIDHLPVVVFEYTFFADGRRDFTYLSPRCEELLGVDPRVLLRGTLSMESFIHPDDWPAFQLNLSSSTERMSEFRWRGRCKGKKGYIWIDAQGSPVQLEGGRLVYRGIFSDITEQKLLEQQYTELVNQMPVGVAIHADGVLKFVNAAASRMIGATRPEELIGMDIRQFVHPSHWETVSRRTLNAMAGKKEDAIELKYVRLDGTLLDVEAAAHPYIFHGEPAVQIIFNDIGERKRAEDTIRKTETLFYQLFKNTPIAVALLNEDGNVTQINPGFTELFSYEQSELVNHSLNEFIVPPERIEEAEHVNTRIRNNQVVRLETQRRRKDGKLIPVIIYGVSVMQEDRTLGIFGMYVDISERKKVEEELEIRNVELDNFVYKVSHDLRAPLSSVLGLTHLASIPGNDDNLLEYMTLIGQKARQLDRFISDVLSHSKNLKMALKVEPVDFEGLITRTFSDLHFLKGAETVQKTIRISGETFYSDPWRIAEIFRNLVSNAIKYRRLDEPVTRIMIQVDVGPRECHIHFADSGIGIAPERRDKIFDMFYRASDQSDGSGLGLYIVRNAIEKLGGTITVQSEEGNGTSFKIRLPDQRLSK